MSAANDYVDPENKKVEGVSLLKRGRPGIPTQNAVKSVWARFTVKTFSDVTAVLPVSNSDIPKAINKVTSDQPLSKMPRKFAGRGLPQRIEGSIKDRDPHFDVDLDLQSRRGYYLGNLTRYRHFLVQDPQTKNCYPDRNLPQSVERIDVSCNRTREKEI